MITLFDQDPETIEARFLAFDSAHPEVYRLFWKFAVELWQRGRRHYSADAILHRVRWECDVNRQRDEGFKLNDHFSSRYARKLAADDPRFQGFFEFRVLRTA